MFTKHKWVVKDKQILPSAWEQVCKYAHPKSATYDPEFYKKDCIVTYRCELTGEEKVERV